MISELIDVGLFTIWSSVSGLSTRHGPKPGRHEAETFSMLEAEALTHFSWEAEALVTKPKPGYLYSTNGKSGSRSLWKSRSRSQALKNLGSWSRNLDPKKASFCYLHQDKWLCRDPGTANVNIQLRVPTASYKSYNLTHCPIFGWRRNLSYISFENVL